MRILTDFYLSLSANIRSIRVIRVLLVEENKEYT